MLCPVSLCADSPLPPPAAYACAGGAILPPGTAGRQPSVPPEMKNLANPAAAGVGLGRRRQGASGELDRSTTPVVTTW